VGGHITTTLRHTEWDVLLSCIESDGTVSGPMVVNFSNPRFSTFEFGEVLDLQPIASGCTASLMHKSVTLKDKVKLDRITNIHLHCKWNLDYGYFETKNDFLTMTLILERVITKVF
jgi:hypothetical protein